MLGADARLPRVLMSDRGTGMYAPSGHVTAAYDRAVRDCGFKLFWGPDAKTQSPDMPDLLLHETAVSWLRGVLRRTKPDVVPWMETPQQWSRRMMNALDECNRSKDVEGLCLQFPERVGMSRGGRREVGLLRGVDSPGLFFMQLNLSDAEAALRKTPFVFYTSHLVRQHSCLQWSRQHVLQCA